MNHRIVLSGVCLALACAGAMAQTPPPAQGQGAAAQQPATPAPKPEAAKPPARETPPDQKAYTEASRITDPEKKIEALEKWKKDFPDSAMRSMANRTILSTLINKFPDQKDRIKDFAASMYRGAPDRRAKTAMAGQIAEQLLDGDLLLSEAEEYAQQAMDSMSLEEYIKDQQSIYQKRKQAPPWTEALEKRFRQSRASRIATLGRIEVKLGHTNKGRKLLEEAHTAIPDNQDVNAALGELAAASGNDAKATEFLLPAVLSGRAPKSAKTALESVFKKSHNGSADGLETMLDTEYRRLYPNPLHVEAYKPGPKRSDRVVLAELFTGSGCPPCEGADLAFDAAMERYTRKEFALVVYHQHIPRPDPMTNPDTQARLKSHGVNGVPTFVIDGKKTVGGGPREYAKNVYERFNKDIEADLEIAAEALLKAQAVVEGNSVKVQASVDSVKSDSKDLKLNIALLEKELRYSGENGIRFHPMVVRAMGGEKGEGFALQTSGGHFDQSFDLDAVSKAIKEHLDDYEAKGHRGESFKFSEKKYQIDRGDLAVVVFVQDDKTKHVLQAAYIDLGTGSHTTTETTQVR
jgi:thiol-disulfide isomerase/thioredoxin